MTDETQLETPTTTDTTDTMPVSEGKPQPEPTDPELAVRDARKESAAYRQRTRAAEEHAARLETQLETMRAQLTATRRANLKNTKAFGRVIPAAIEDVLDMIDVPGMYDEEGKLDEDKLTEAISEILESKPYLNAYRVITSVTRDILAGSEPRPIGSAASDRLQKALTPKRH